MSERTPILIVEDSPTQALQLQVLLERRGHEVVLAGDGVQALALLAGPRPGLVISDIVMPEMDGYELCRRIRAGADTADLPVLLLTALSDTHDLLAGLACGADAFLTKPYDEEQFLGLVTRMLEGGWATDGAGAGDSVELSWGGKRQVVSAEKRRIITLLCTTYEAAVQRNTELLRSQDELRDLNARLENLVAERTAELQATLDKVKVLTGLLPICANCKNIRDDKGEWKPLEVYIGARTDAAFTHGLCPGCIREFFPALGK